MIIRKVISERLYEVPSINSGTYIPADEDEVFTDGYWVFIRKLNTEDDWYSIPASQCNLEVTLPPE